MAINENGFPLPQPIEKKGMNPTKANDEAFYTASLVTPDKMEQTFNTVYSGLVEDGESLVHEAAVKQYAKEQDAGAKQVMANLFADTTISKQDKYKALQNYSDGGYISNDLRKKYIQDTAVIDTGTNDSETAAQEEIVDTVNTIGMQEDVDAKTEEGESFVEEAGGEILALLNIIPQTVGGVTTFAQNTVEAIRQKMETGEVNWENLEADAVKNQGKVGEIGSDFAKHMASKENLIYTIAKALGLDDELDDSYVNAGIENVGEGLVYLADKAVEKKLLGLESQEEALYMLEAVGTGIYGGVLTKGLATKYKGKKREKNTRKAQEELNAKIASDKAEADLRAQGAKEADIQAFRESLKPAQPKKKVAKKKAKKNNYKATKARKNSPAKVTEKANPNAAKDMLTLAIVDNADGTKTISYVSGKNKVAIVEENILPDAKVNADTPKVTVDINSSIDKVLPVETKKLINDEAILEVLFDDNIVKRENRLADIERRLRVNEETALVYNQASSKLNITSDFLDGTSVYTQGDAYPFTGRNAVIKQAELLEGMVARMKQAEIDADTSAGLGTAKALEKQYKNNKVVIRHTKSGVAMSLKEFKKTNIKSGSFQIEHQFRKEYDLLSNEMLGETFVGKHADFIMTPKAVSKAFTNSSLGDWFVGTGFSARWYEKARFDLGNRAAKVANKVVEDFTKIMANNKQLRQPMADLIHMQERLKRDTISRVEVARNFPHLKDADLNLLMEAQDAWRKGNDSLYEITNIGEKQRLATNGYKQGYFINGEFKGAVKEVKPAELKTLNKDTLVYSPVTDSYIKYTGKDMKIVRMDGNMLGKLRKNGVESDYIVVDKNHIGSLPHRVVNKLPGHSFKQYKSNFYIEAVPKKLNRNGKDISEGEIRHNHKETRGVANTEADAIALIKQMEDPSSKNYIGSDYEIIQKPRNASLDDIQDHSFEYRLQEDLYRNSLGRAEDMKHLDGSKVLEDPLKAFNESARRISRTGTSSQFHKAYKEAFMRDFGDVLDTDANGLPQYPTSLEQINAIGKKGNRVELESLVKDAKTIWRRQTAFQRGGSSADLDRVTQNLLHNVAGTLEKAGVFKEFIPGIVRKLGDEGLTGLTQRVKRLTSYAYITYVNPVRHWLIQPAVFMEQLIIHPKSAVKNFTKAPILTNMLLKGGSDILKGVDNATELKLIPKKYRKDAMQEFEVMKREGILESIDQNLAAIETVKGYVPKIEAPANPAFKVGRTIDNMWKTTSHKVNNLGFARGELMNRVGLWLQAKEMWVANPLNKGKDWRSPRNAKEISFDSWRQSGAMTTAGAIKSQKAPILGVVTQFQAIGVKILMNMLQHNATNLTKAQRGAVFANRLMMHGLPLGVVGGAGKMIYDYIASSDDPEVQEYAELVSKGYLDRSLNTLLNVAFGENGKEYDINFSESASLGATSPIVDTLQSIWNVGQYVGGDNDAPAPRIPSVQVLTSVVDKINAVTAILKYEPINTETLGKVLVEAGSFTSLVNNANKAWMYYNAGEVIDKKGRKKGISIDGVEALLQTAGFKTRAEANQWAATEISRDADDRIKGQIEDFDEDMMNVLKQDPDNFDKYLQVLNFQTNLMVENGVYTPLEMDKIMSGVIAKQASRVESDEAINLISWVLNRDVIGDQERLFISKFRNHPDPKVKEMVELLDNQLTINVGEDEWQSN